MKKTSKTKLFWGHLSCYYKVKNFKMFNLIVSLQKLLLILRCLGKITPVLAFLLNRLKASKFDWILSKEFVTIS